MNPKLCLANESTLRTQDSQTRLQCTHRSVPPVRLHSFIIAADDHDSTLVPPQLFETSLHAVLTDSWRSILVHG
jgi:hypothetical protein